MPPRTLSRRAALLLPLAAGGCNTFDDWFGGARKTPLPGKRYPVLPDKRGLVVDNPAGRPVTVPDAVANADLPQPGGNPAHVMGNQAAGDRLATIWSANIGTGGGYREKLTARPVSAGGRVYTMDTDGQITALDLKTGARIWRVSTQPANLESTNIGGGVCLDGGKLYASTGYGEILCLDPAGGKILWRKGLPSAARAAPTVGDGNVYVPTLDAQLAVYAQADGAKQWAYQSTATETTLLGLPSPAYDAGLLVAGFGAGDLACLRTTGGAVLWTESLGSIRGGTSLVDLSPIRGLPVIANGRVYAAGLGGQVVSVDLRTGRRLWSRDIAAQEAPLVVGEWVYLVSDEQKLVAMNAGDGAIAWITQLPHWGDEVKQWDPIRWTGPVMASGRLIVAGSTAQALTINPVNGQIVGRQDLKGAVSIPPVVVAGTLLLLHEDGTLQAMR